VEQSPSFFHFFNAGNPSRVIQDQLSRPVLPLKSHFAEEWVQFLIAAQLNL
jgi:hypothetical protein